MSRKKRFIQSLTTKERKALLEGKKSSNGYQFQQRCHAILLSESGTTVSELESIFSVSKQTVYSWFDRWESDGITGLHNKSGRGRKALLRIDNKTHVKGVEKAIKKVNERGGNLLAEVDKELNLDQGLTQRMLRLFLKKVVTSTNDVEES